MTSSWFYLVIIYILANSTSKLIQKYALKDEEVHPTAFSAFWHLGTGIVALPAVFVDGLSVPQQPVLWILPLTSGLIFTACMLMYFHALKNTEVSQIEAIATTRAIWVVVLGVLFFGETLSWSKAIGGTLIFFGLVIVYWKKNNGNGFSKHHAFVFFYALLNSSAYAVDKYALNYFSVGFYNTLLYLLPGFFTIIIFPKALSNIRLLIKPKKNNYLIVLSCIVQAISTLSLYKAYKIGELSVIGPLSQTTTVTIIIVGIVFLNERWNIRRKLVGTGFALLGVIFLKFVSF